LTTRVTETGRVRSKKTSLCTRRGGVRGDPGKKRKRKKKKGGRSLRIFPDIIR